MEENTNESLIMISISVNESVEASEPKCERRKTLPPTDIACTLNTNESSQYDGVVKLE